LEKELEWDIDELHEGVLPSIQFFPVREIFLPFIFENHISINLQYFYL
jgi:hypothetical protein